MKVIHARNVNWALYNGIQLLKDKDNTRIISPRGKETIEYNGPVATVYKYPDERVLILAERDANPFFHFFESLWILAGRKDVKWLAQFNSNIKDYSDDGHEFHGAYGWRLREEQGDQLNTVVHLLKKDPDTRRAVLQIWNGVLDLNTDSLDVPCNDMIFLKIREGLLHITVLCRSNDIIWGCYGANVVQFSMLQEYLAGRIGMGMGTYTQISDSFHVYTDLPVWQKLKDDYKCPSDPYQMCYVTPYPLMNVPELFDTELKQFIACPETGLVAQNRFFANVAHPMWMTWKAHKDEKMGLKWIEMVKASDWRTAGKMWLEGREGNE